jgi:hypothetical protein
MDRKPPKNGNTGRGRKTVRKQTSTYWRSRRFPGADTPEQLKESFAILNDWAHHLQGWENKIRAMCGILEVECNLTPAQFESVVASIDKGKHSKRDIQKVLRASGSKVGGSSDVVGHPPDPPYTDESLS